MAAMPSLHFATSVMAATCWPRRVRSPGASAELCPRARLRPRLSRRALRRRPARRAGSDGGRPPGRAGAGGPDRGRRARRRALCPVGEGGLMDEPVRKDGAAGAGVRPRAAGQAAEARRRGDAARPHHAAPAAVASACSSSRRSPSSTSSCPSWPGCARRGTSSTRPTRSGWSSPPCSSSFRSAATSLLFRAVFVRGESRIGWRESYQITMAGLGGLAPVRRGRERWRRPDGLGAAPVGHRAAGRRLPDGRLPGPALRRLHGRAGDRRCRPAHRRLPRRRRLRDHADPGDLRRRVDPRYAGAVAAAPGRRAPPRGVGRRRPAGGQARGQGAKAPALVASGVRTAIGLVRTGTSVRSARWPGGASTSRCSGRRSTRSGRRRRSPSS